MLPQTQEFVLRFDGACNPNPGPMGIGYTIGLVPSSVGGQGGVINIPPPPFVRVGAQIGEGTNNIAEYHALVSGLRHAIRLGLWGGIAFSDSMLVVQQVLGQWKVRDAHLRRLHGEAVALTTLLSAWTIAHIRREENTEADKLSREMVFDEPALPPTDIVKGHSRALHSWQAAFVRHHWLAGIRNSYFLGRVFDVAPSQIEAIGNGTAYKDATFEGVPTWSQSLQVAGA